MCVSIVLKFKMYCYLYQLDSLISDIIRNICVNKTVALMLSRL